MLEIPPKSLGVSMTEKEEQYIIPDKKKNR